MTEGISDGPESVYAEFIIRGDYLPTSSISEDLQLQPTKAWGKGEIYGKHNSPRLISTWAYNTEDKIDSCSIETHCLYLLEKLESRTEVIDKFLLKYPDSISVQLHWKLADFSKGPSIASSILLRLASCCHFLDISGFDVGPYVDQS